MGTVKLIHPYRTAMAWAVGAFVVGLLATPVPSDTAVVAKVVACVVVGSLYAFLAFWIVLPIQLIRRRRQERRS